MAPTQSVTGMSHENVFHPTARPREEDVRFSYIGNDMDHRIQNSFSGYREMKSPDHQACLTF